MLTQAEWCSNVENCYIKDVDLKNNVKRWTVDKAKCEEKNPFVVKQSEIKWSNKTENNNQINVLADS